MNWGRQEPAYCRRCGTAIEPDGDICPGCDAAEVGAQVAQDPELRWGYSEAVCEHGIPLSGYCHQCETECVHGEYGPGCRRCQEAYGP